MRTLPQDVGYALRGLLRRPVFTTIIIATIALGVGANTAIFSVVNGILLRPLPYGDAERIVSFGHEAPQWLTSQPNFIDYEKHISSFESLASYTQNIVTLNSDGEPERVGAARVSDNFFRVMSVPPLLGRAFAPDEFEGNPPTAVMLSYGLWKRRFGGDSSIVNRSVIMNGIKRTVVGVMPAYFNYPQARTDVFTPMARFNLEKLEDRSMNYLFMVGKFKRGLNVERVRNEAKLVASRIMTDNPNNFDPRNPLVPHIEVIGDQLVKNSRPYLAALLGAVAFVLLIACVYVSKLLLAHSEGRRREMAVRSALGASRTRLVTQMLTESGLLALVGGVFGLAIAWAGTRTLVSLAPDTIPRLDEITIDWRVILFTLGVSMLAGFIIGVMPAIRAARESASEALKASGKTLNVGVARGARRMLVMVEVALAVVALSGAGMLLRSLWHLEQVNIGFNPESALTARLALSTTQYDNERASVFYAQLMHKLEAMPGAQAVGAAGWLPVVDGGGLWGIVPEGRAYGPGLPDDQPNATPQQVTPGYFKAIGMRLLQGRDFEWTDRAGAVDVVIISKSLANKIWPNENAIGKRFRLGGAEAKLPFMTVVGIVDDILSRGYTDKPEPTMYFAHQQHSRGSYYTPHAMGVVIRTTGNPMMQTAALKAAVHSLDPLVPVSDILSLEDVVGTSVSTRRFSTSLLAAFAALALLLAGLGTYGVIAYGVSQRTYEIGVRMALGAERGAVMRLVMLEGLRMCLGGLVVGLAGSIALGYAIRSMLFETSTLDLPALGVASALLLLVAFVATALPTRRALAVSPTQALRGD